MPVLGMAADLGNEEIVRELLSAGADPAQGNPTGYAPLQNAACGGFPTIVRMLLDAGAKVDQENSDGETPLMGSAFVAVCMNDKEERMLSSLPYLADNMKAINASDAWFRERCDRNTQAASLLIDAGATVNHLSLTRTALGIASRFPCTPLVNLLIQRGANVNLTDPNGYGKTPLIEAAESNNPTVVEILLRAGADPRTKYYEETALMIAAKRGYIEIVHLLQENIDLYWR
jgi:ankyrin repeat protein